MIILDNSIVNCLLDEGISISADWHVSLPEDLFEEVSYAFQLRGLEIPKNYSDLNEVEAFDNAEYYKNYHLMLNKHSGRSFYGMTGFGDISLLAAVKTLIDHAGRQAQIPGIEEVYEIYTGDRKLKTRLNTEFSTKPNVSIYSFDDLKRMLAKVG